MNILAFMAACLMVISVELVRTVTWTKNEAVIKIKCCRRWCELRCARAHLRKLKSRWSGRR